MARRYPASETVALPPFAFRAEVVPASVDPEARTVGLVWTTGADVERENFWTGDRYVERLDVSEKAIRLGRLNNKAPLLDSHSGWSVASTLGVVVPGSARIADGKGVATVRFSRRPEVEAVWTDVKDGILANVSVGYRVHKYERTPADEETRTPEIRRAVDWEPYEVSIVPMGADDGAKIRAATEKGLVPRSRCVIVTQGGEVPRMAPKATRELRADVVEPNDDGTIPDGYELGDDGKCHRIAAEPTERELGAAQERDRVEGILSGLRAAGMRTDTPFGIDLIKNGTPLSEARGKILDALRDKSRDGEGPRPTPSGAGGARVTRDAFDGVYAGITRAFLNRLHGDKMFPLDENARHFRAYSIVRCAEEVLEHRGNRTRHLSKSEILGLALGLDTRVGYHTTSDFVGLLGDVASQSLRAMYAESPQTWLPLATKIQISDFKPVRRVAIGEAPDLRKVLEHGEFTRGTIGESKELMSLATYGRIFGITRQVLINDDLSAFSGITSLFARAARRLESNLVWAEILANANMADGFALFSSQHANLASPGTEITVASLGAARAAMSLQRNPDGGYTSLSARYLIVPPSLETRADQYTAAVTATLSGSVNPFGGRLTVISEPRLEGGLVIPDPLKDTVLAGSSMAWYLSASPDQIGIIDYGYLDGQEGPTMDTRVGFDIDGVEFKCREDFVAKAVNYRGLYKNPGAPPTLGALAAADPAAAAAEAEHHRKR
jgi:Caudovirus prohead serine protease